MRINQGVYMRHLTFLIAILTLTACTTAITYTKPGATDTDFQRDQNDCLVKAGQAGYRGGGLNSNIKRQQFIKQCMYGQGYTEASQ
jgi:hypothetical protein